MIRFVHRNIKRVKKIAERIKTTRKVVNKIIKGLNLLASMYSLYTMLEPHIKKFSESTDKA